MFDRYKIVSEDALRLAAQKTTLCVDTLRYQATKSVDFRLSIRGRRYQQSSWWMTAPAGYTRSRRTPVAPEAKEQGRKKRCVPVR